MSKSRLELVDCRARRPSPGSMPCLSSDLSSHSRDTETMAGLRLRDIRRGTHAVEQRGIDEPDRGRGGGASGATDKLLYNSGSEDFMRSMKV